VSSSQISEAVWARVRAQAKNQCGYCRSLQKYVLGILEIEHIIPKALGGTDDEENLWRRAIASTFRKLSAGDRCSNNQSLDDIKMMSS